MQTDQKKKKHGGANRCIFAGLVANMSKGQHSQFSIGVSN